MPLRTLKQRGPKSRVLQPQLLQAPPRPRRRERLVLEPMHLLPKADPRPRPQVPLGLLSHLAVRKAQVVRYQRTLVPLSSPLLLRASWAYSLLYYRPLLGFIFIALHALLLRFAPPVAWPLYFSRTSIPYNSGIILSDTRIPFTIILLFDSWDFNGEPLCEPLRDTSRRAPMTFVRDLGLTTWDRKIDLVK